MKPIAKPDERFWVWEPDHKTKNMYPFRVIEKFFEGIWTWDPSNGYPSFTRNREEWDDFERDTMTRRVNAWWSRHIQGRQGENGVHMLDRLNDAMVRVWEPDHRTMREYPYEIIRKHFRGKWDTDNAGIHFKRDNEPWPEFHPRWER
jgi:hypothetical protein